MSKKIGFIGAGNMASAIIGGMLKNEADASEIFVFDMDLEKTKALEKQGLVVCGSNDEVIKKCDIIILAVKPQVYPAVLDPLYGKVEKDKVFVSIAAGISTDYIKRALGVDCPCVRVMPNTPLLVGKGATAICKTENVSDEDFDIVFSLFSSSGVCELLPEELMNVVIAVNGSSPAFFYLFAKAMADYAAGQGIDKKAAMSLICATMEGSAKMLLESGSSPDELIKKVSSPGGTTLQALSSLERDGFEDIVKSAMNACTRRAEELAKDS